MKLQILSDLHLEFAPMPAPEADADVVVLAGDIGVGSQGVEWATQFAPRPVIYVPGNHEFYGRHLSRTVVRMKELAAEAGHIHVLDNDEAVIGGVRFLGCTLWTDFRLFGSSPEETAWAMATANNYVSDFSVIRYGGDRTSGFFTPGRSAALHRVSVSWLGRKLAEPFSGPTVVVTHHAPSRGSVADRYLRNPVTAAFASDLDHLMGKASLWVHGHTHDSFDYDRLGTRVVCNPRGYVDARKVQPENLRFNADWVVDIGR